MLTGISYNAGMEMSIALDEKTAPDMNCSRLFSTRMCCILSLWVVAPYIMPGMPPIPGAPAGGIGASFSGLSATSVSVVSTIEAMEAAF